MIQDNWLEDVGDLCVTTLEMLNTKVQSGSVVTNDDKLLRDICLGYLYMLSLCNEEGLISETHIPLNLRKNITIH